MDDGAVTLVSLSREHIEKTFTWIVDPHFQQAFLMRGQPTWEGHIAYFDRILADCSQLAFAIMNGNSHCGNCGLKNIVSRKEGELWIYIGDASMRKKGIGRSAVDLLIRKAFELLHLEMIYVHVGHSNMAARHLYEIMGFKKVLLREDGFEQWTDRSCEVIRMERKVS
jgi:RimJ/RimL family protein N-acetyltransferase